MIGLTCRPYEGKPDDARYDKVIKLVLLFNAATKVRRHAFAHAGYFGFGAPQWDEAFAQHSTAGWQDSRKLIYAE
jgi:hypothetical protein